MLGEADSRCITHKHQQGQLHAVRLHTSRKLLAVSALHMCQHRGPWFKSLLSALQLRLRQISSRFTALLLSMLHLWVAAVISPGIGMSSNMAASPPSHFWGPTATLPGTAELQQRTRSLLQTPWANPVTTPLTPLTVTEPSASPQGQLPFGGSLPSGIASFAQVTATTNAASDVPSASTLQTVSNASSNRSLLIAIVVLAAIGVSVLLVALLTAFIVRRRYA